MGRCTIKHNDERPRKQTSGFFRNARYHARLYKKHGPLPHYARLIDADANTMYPCLKTEDCISALQLWTATYPERLKGIPLNFLWTVLKTVMDENVFRFREHYFIQKKGTAMVTSVAKEWATGSYRLYERSKIFKKHFGKFLKIYKRFIDDIFGL